MVQSLIAQGSEYPLKKPAGFHWDFFLLGITTFVAGLLGIPAPNGMWRSLMVSKQASLIVIGLIPQAPLHTASLVVLGYEDSSASSSATAVSDTEEASPRRINAPSSPLDQHAIQLGNMEDGHPQISRTRSGQQARRRFSMASVTEARKRRRSRSEENKGKREVPIAVVEQRVSNLAQGALCA